MVRVLTAKEVFKDTLSLKDMKAAPIGFKGRVRKMADCDQVAVCTNECSINKLSEMADCKESIAVCTNECNINKISKMAYCEENVKV